MAHRQVERAELPCGEDRDRGEGMLTWKTAVGGGGWAGMRIGWEVLGDGRPSRGKF